MGLPWWYESEPNFVFSLARNDLGNKEGLPKSVIPVRLVKISMFSSIGIGAKLWR